MSNYNERDKDQIKVDLEELLFEQIKRDPHNIKLIKTYSLFKIAYELENIRGHIWDIKHLLVKG